MTSASTLSRRARAEKNPRKAKALRAEAATKRRDEREAKAFQASTTAELNAVVRAGRRKRKAKKPANKIIKGLNQALAFELARKPRPMTGLGGAEIKRIVDNVQQRRKRDNERRVRLTPHPKVLERHARDMADLQRLADSIEGPLVMTASEAANDERPGGGEVVGGYLAHKANELAQLARKKGGVDAIQRQLATLECDARSEEAFDARQRERKAVQAIREEMRDKAVCGFIALFEASEANKVVPAATIISCDTLANLVDALKANGYTANGRR